MQKIFRQFIYKFGKFFGSILILLLIIYFLPIQKPYLGEITQKHKLLELIPGERLIIVGGSNVAYGMDSERLQKFTQMPVINMGLHGYLGLRFILNDIYPFLHRGDIVILIPEYEHFYNDFLEGSSYKLSELLDTYPSGIRSLEISQIRNLLNDFIPMLRSKILRYFSEKDKDPFFNVEMFNVHGDVNNQYKISSNSPIENDAYVKVGDRFNPNTVIYLNEINGKISRKGAKFYLIYPAGRKTNCMASGSMLEMLDHTLMNSLDFPILSTPSESCIDDMYFLDTIYHLNNEGTDLRMAKIEEILVSNGIIEGNKSVSNWHIS